jgi:hypothetical protein
MRPPAAGGRVACKDPRRRQFERDGRAVQAGLSLRI